MRWLSIEKKKKDFDCHDGICEWFKNSPFNPWISSIGDDRFGFEFNWLAVYSSLTRLVCIFSMDFSSFI